MNGAGNQTRSNSALSVSSSAVGRAVQYDSPNLLEKHFDELASPPAGMFYIYTSYVLAEDLTTARDGTMLKRIVREMAVATSPIEASEIAKRVH